MLDWLVHYDRKNLPGDALAGVVVATLLIPQGMAYALLAGLPPQFGLYAGLLPLVIYALLGSSQFVTIGPVAMISLLVAAGVGALAEPGSARYLAFATATALVVGFLQIAMGVARLGALTNFLSHPVLSGFTSAAAIIIGLSQMKHLIGVTMPPTENVIELLAQLARAIPSIHVPTLAIGVTSMLLLLAFRHLLPPLLARRMPGSPTLAQSLTRSGPIVAAIAGTVTVMFFGTGRNGGVSIVGEIPVGLPFFSFPDLAARDFFALIPLAATIGFVGFLESVSVARTLAAKRRQKVDANRELLALGAANLAAGVTGAYPVTGGFSRSAVNYSAGANTRLASMITAALIAMAALFLMPLFHHLPQAVLAAIIITAVVELIDVATLRRLWRYDKADAATLILTFVSVLGFGIIQGIFIGTVSAIALYLRRTSRPHMAVVGRVAGTEHFRNVMRYRTETLPHALFLRIDENLYFANTKVIEEFVLSSAADRASLRHLVLICSSVNFIDADALDTLTGIMTRMRDAGIQLYLAEVKGPVMDRLARTEFLKHLGRERVFLSTQEAFKKLSAAIPS